MHTTMIEQTVGNILKMPDDYYEINCYHLISIQYVTGYPKDERGLGSMGLVNEVPL